MSRLASRLDVEETAQQPQVLILYGGMRKFLRVCTIARHWQIMARTGAAHLCTQAERAGHVPSHAGVWGPNRHSGWPGLKAEGV